MTKLVHIYIDAMRVKLDECNLDFPLCTSGGGIFQYVIYCCCQKKITSVQFVKINLNLELELAFIVLVFGHMLSPSFLMIKLQELFIILIFNSIFMEGFFCHYSGVIWTSLIASQITDNLAVCSSVCLGLQQKSTIQTQCVGNPHVTSAVRVSSAASLYHGIFMYGDNWHGCIWANNYFYNLLSCVQHTHTLM